MSGARSPSCGPGSVHKLRKEELRNVEKYETANCSLRQGDEQKNKRNKTKYIEDITRWRQDMNFIFEWQKCHEKIKFISSSGRVMFFLLYRQKDIDKIIERNY